MTIACPVCGTRVDDADQGLCRRCGSGSRPPLAAPSNDPTIGGPPPTIGGASPATLDAIAAATLPGTTPCPDTTATISDTATPRPLELSSRSIPVPGPEGVPFGRYVLTAQIGRGGMGVVYRAWDLELQRTVALKTLIGDESGEGRTPMPISASPDVTPPAVQRFLREARSAARLRHPNVISVYDVGQHEGRYFFTMEHVDGVGLDRWVRGEGSPNKARPSFREIAAVLEGAARGLAAAHAERIVHRDVKPSNILVDAKDHAHLGDFGLAKDVEMASTSGLTLSGALLGTPTFMSPEQASGDLEAIGPRSDVFALGSVMYFALAGEVPFAGPTLLGLLRSILEEEPVRPAKRNSAIPRDLEIICLKALEKDPERRYEGAEALAEDLGRFARGEAIHARPRSLAYRASLFARRHVKPIAAATLLLAAATVALVFAGRAKRESELAEAQRKRNVARDLLQQMGEIDEFKDRANLKAQILPIEKAIAADPTYALAYLCRGRVRERLGEFDAALADYGAATGLDPTLAEAFYHAGCVRLWRGEPDESAYRQATSDFEGAGRAAPGSPFALLGQAYIFALEKKRAEALAIVDRLAGGEARHPDVFFLRAALHSFDIQAGATRVEFHEVDDAWLDYDGAERDLTTALELDPLSPWGHAIRGRIRFGLGDLDGAREDLLKSLDLAPENNAVAFMAARVTLALGQVDESYQLISKAIQLKRKDRYLSFRAILAVYNEDYVVARRDADAAVELGETDPQARFVSALLYAIDGDETKARADIQAANAEWQADLEKIRDFDREILKNAMLVQVVVKALADFDRIFLLAPARKKGLRETQAVLSLSKWFHEGLVQLGELRNADPEVGLVFFEMVKLLEDRPKFQEVFPFMMKELGLKSPLFASTDVKWIGKLMEEQALMARKRLYRPKDYLKRAGAYYRRGDLAKALTDLEEAERINAGDADVLYALATVLARQGNGDRALVALRRAFECGWGHPEYTREDSDFASIKDRPEFQKLVQ